MKKEADIDTFNTENIVRCPDPDTADKMIDLIKRIKKGQLVVRMVMEQN